jgi:hypothetical protein
VGSDLHPLGSIIAVALDSTISWIVFMPAQTPEKRLMANAWMPRSRISCTLAGKNTGSAAGLEDVVALVRGGGALGDVVVPGHRNHAAPGRGAGHVGVLEHVGAAVHARALAVPDAEHAVELVGARRRKAQLLRAPEAVAASSSLTPGWNTMFCAFR